MLRCKQCSAECQNPKDRYGETGMKWLRMHNGGTGSYVHNLDDDNLLSMIEIAEIQQYYQERHDQYGNRL